MEKISQTDTSCRYLHQTDFARRSPRSHKHTYLNSNKKRMLPRKAASSYQLFGSLFIHFQQDLEQLVLLIGCLGRKKFITLQRDISAAIILSTQLLKQLGHRENEADIKSPRFILFIRKTAGINVI